MKLVRTGCFETNSSSCHSISISSDTSRPYNSILPNDEGIIQIRPLGFGWNEEKFYNPEDKLAYLLIYIRDWVEDDKKEEFTNVLNDVVLSHTKAKGLVLMEDPKCTWSDDFGYIDHQSVESKNFHYLFECKNKLKDFLFHCDSYLKTDNDNH